jgi:hypothetical protein
MKSYTILHVVMDTTDPNSLSPWTLCSQTFVKMGAVEKRPCRHGHLHSRIFHIQKFLIGVPLVKLRI